MCYYNINLRLFQLFFDFYQSYKQARPRTAESHRDPASQRKLFLKKYERKHPREGNTSAGYHRVKHTCGEIFCPLKLKDRRNGAENAVCKNDDYGKKLKLVPFASRSRLFKGKHAFKNKAH